MDGKKLTDGRCPHCGGVEVAAGLVVTQTAEVNPIGLGYTVAKIFSGSEQLCADLCLGCGSVVRLFVKELKRNWIQK